MAKHKTIKRISSEYYEMGDIYAFARIGSDSEVAGFDSERVFKVDGLIMLYVREGDFDIEINFRHFEISANSIVMLPHGSVLKIAPVTSTGIEVNLISFALDFLKNINIDYSAIINPSMFERQTPAGKLTAEESSIIARYFDLFKLNAINSLNLQIETSIVSSLISALVYQLVQFQYKTIGRGDSGEGSHTNRNAYVHDFMKLIRVYHKQERTVKFYAEKLCISAKYLSLLVKDATGRSAAKWIDEFVIMEAKNLLRFSGKNVQQVAYELNFSNQSSFGKYFKHMTGQSPTDFQKS